MFELVERIMNLDIGNRGVDKLYEPARSRVQLCCTCSRPVLARSVGAVMSAVAPLLEDQQK
jgi:hypothetical protein